MKATLRTLFASLPFALAALAAGPANARTPVDVHVQIVQRAPAAVVSPGPVYVTDYDDRQWRGERREWRDDRYERREWRDDRHEWRGERRAHACGAQRWDPQVRYAPGEVVRRKGELYIARRVSAHVWNLNSPPEWTPNYWAPARC